MKLEELKKQLQAHFSNNRIKSVLDLMEENLSIESDIYDDFLLIRQRYNHYQDEKMAEVVEYSQGDVFLNKITKSILHLIRKLAPSDLSVKKNKILNEIKNPILLISSPDLTIPSLEDFMISLNFTNVTIKDSIALEERNQFDLIILDNRHLPSCFRKDDFDKLEENLKSRVESRIKLMEAIIHETPLFMIHFGEQLFWINSFRKRIHAANSQFSLFARTKEMLDFINTYRV